MNHLQTEVANAIEEQGLRPLAYEEVKTLGLKILMDEVARLGFVSNDVMTARPDVLAGMLFVAQYHDAEIVPRLEEHFADQRTRREAARVRGDVGNIRKGLNKDGKPRGSSKVFGAVALVHKTCDEMKGRPRKEVIEKLVEMGVNKNTAATQYAAWNKKQTATAA